LEILSILRVQVYLLHRLQGYKVETAAHALVHLAITKGDVFNVYAVTAVNWRLMAHAAAAMGGVVATAYETLSEDGLQHSLPLVTDSQAPTSESDKGLAGPAASARGLAVGAHHPSASGSQAQPKAETMETMDLDDSHMDADVDPEVAFSRGPQ